MAGPLAAAAGPARLLCRTATGPARRAAAVPARAAAGCRARRASVVTDCVNAATPEATSRVAPAAAGPLSGRRGPPLALLTGAAAGAGLGLLLGPDAASALAVEPANALSLPTWAVHVSSVSEWMVAMALVWRYAEVSGNPRWKGLAWGMLPALTSAMAACTYHFFYNAPELSWIVTYQAGSTLVGNATLWWAAYRIYQGSQARADAATGPSEGSRPGDKAT